MKGFIQNSILLFICALCFSACVTLYGGSRDRTEFSNEKAGNGFDENFEDREDRDDDDSEDEGDDDDDDDDSSGIIVEEEDLSFDAIWPADLPFSVGVSYYGGGCESARPHIESDLQALAAAGMKGPHRVWLYWYEPNCSAIDRNGNVTAQARNVRRILEIGQELGLTFDLTLPRQDDMASKSAHLRGVENAIAEFGDFKNWIFDVSNEAIGHTTLYAQWTFELTQRAKELDPSRIIFSSSANLAGGRNVHAQFIRNGGVMDVASLHTLGVDPFTYVQQVNNFENQMRTGGITPLPVYFQEPARNGYCGACGPNDRTDYWSLEQFKASVRNARLAGATAWVFHTDAFYNPSRGSFYQQLDSTERQFMDWFRSTPEF